MEPGDERRRRGDEKEGEEMRRGGMKGSGMEEERVGAGGYGCSKANAAERVENRIIEMNLPMKTTQP